MPSFFVRLLCLVSSPRFLAWLFRPAFKDNKVISSFSTFLRLLLSFFDIPRIISQFSESLGALRIPSLVSVPLLFFSFLISEPLGVLRIASLVSASLLFLLSVFCLSIFSCSLFTFFLLFSFSSLSHLTSPASFRYSLRLFSLFSFSFQSLLVFSASLRWSLRLFSFFFLYSVFRSSLVSYSPFFSYSFFFSLVLFFS